jgi:hypothetical protein
MLPNTETPQLPAFIVPSFAQLLGQGEIQPGRFLFGYQDDGQPMYGDWKQLYSAALAGKSGSGKTTTLRWIAAQSAIGGARFVVLDLHGESGEESLAGTLAPLSSRMLCPAATTDTEILDTIRLVKSIGDARLKGDRDRTPIVVCVDELTALLNRSTVGPAVGELLEAIAQEFRKVNIYALASGQIWTAARTGQTSALRSSFASAMVHRMDRDGARILLPADVARQVESFQRGRCIFKTTAGDYVPLSIPNTTARDIVDLAATLQSDGSVQYALPRGDGETHAFDFPHLATTLADEPENADTGNQIGAIGQTSGNQKFDAKTLRVRQLLLAGNSHSDIIREVWGATTGRAYTDAKGQLEAIIAKLVA